MTLTDEEMADMLIAFTSAKDVVMSITTAIIVCGDVQQGLLKAYPENEEVAYAIKVLGTLEETITDILDASSKEMKESRLKMNPLKKLVN